jgi:hypothetical protein
MNKRKKIESNGLAGNILSYKLPKGKNLEQVLMQVLLKELGLSYLTLNASEKPDFFFQLSDNKSNVGCEITLLYTKSAEDLIDIGSPEVRFWDKWKKFAQQLNEELGRNIGLANIYGAVHFQKPSYKVLDEADKDALINEIVVVLKDSPDLERIENFSSKNFPQLKKHVSHIWTAEITDIPPLWWAAHLRSGKLDDPGLAIVEIIKKKANKAKSYDWKNAEHKWLVICALGQGLRDRFPAYTAKNFEALSIPIPFTNVMFFAWGQNGSYILQLHPEVKKLKEQ